MVPTNKPSLLIVDDDPLISDTLTYVLSKDFDISAAESRGVGRVWIEFFRPDQPKIGDSPISYSMVAAAVMAVAGAILLMIRYKAINLAFAESWEDEYRIAGQVPAPQEDADEPVEEETPPVKRVSTRKAKTQVDDEPVKKTATRRKTTDKTSPKKTSTRTKKSQ